MLNIDYFTSRGVRLATRDSGPPGALANLISQAASEIAAGLPSRIMESSASVSSRALKCYTACYDGKLEEVKRIVEEDNDETLDVNAEIHGGTTAERNQNVPVASGAALSVKRTTSA